LFAFHSAYPLSFCPRDSSLSGQRARNTRPTPAPRSILSPRMLQECMQSLASLFSLLSDEPLAGACAPPTLPETTPLYALKVASMATLTTRVFTTALVNPPATRYPRLMGKPSNTYLAAQAPALAGRHPPSLQGPPQRGTRSRKRQDIKRSSAAV